MQILLNNISYLWITPQGNSSHCSFIPIKMIPGVKIISPAKGRSSAEIQAPGPASAEAQGYNWGKSKLRRC